MGTLYLASHKGKRRWPRYKVDAPIRVLAEGAENAPLIDGRCVLMSPGGMCFFALGNFAPGTQVCLEFVNPGSDTPDTGQSGRIRGTIRNRTVYLYGVEYEAAQAELIRPPSPRQTLRRPGRTNA